MVGSSLGEKNSPGKGNGILHSKQQSCSFPVSNEVTARGKLHT
jgi:hypothetical protein